MFTLHSVLRRIVRNDAIRVDPPEIYNWRILALAASVRHPPQQYDDLRTAILTLRTQACFAGALFGVDAGIIGGVLAMPDFQRYIHTRPLTRSQQNSLAKQGIRPRYPPGDGGS